MESKNVPYIGITDFTHASQVEPLRQLLVAEKSKRLLHVGVMTNRKIIRGEPSRWSDVYPRKNQLEKIFKRQDGVLNVLHYADYDPDITTYSDLISAVLHAGLDVDALQLDMIWPHTVLLQRVKNYFVHVGRNIKLIIQVNEKAIGQEDNSPWDVADRLAEYDCAGVMDYALFDMSGGTGTPLQAEILHDYIWAAKDTIPDLSVAIAGGLGPTTTHLAEPLFKRFRNLSIDAQSRLRPSGNAMKPIGWNLALEYVRRAIDLEKLYG